MQAEFSLGARAAAALLKVYRAQGVRARFVGQLAGRAHLPELLARASRDYVLLRMGLRAPGLQLSQGYGSWPPGRPRPSGAE